MERLFVSMSSKNLLGSRLNAELTGKLKEEVFFKNDSAILSGNAED